MPDNFLECTKAPSPGLKKLLNDLSRAVNQLQKMTGGEGVTVSVIGGVPCIAVKKQTENRPILVVLNGPLSFEGSAGATVRTRGAGASHDADALAEGGTGTVYDGLLNSDDDDIAADTQCVAQLFADGRYYVISANCHPNASR